MRRARHRPGDSLDLLLDTMCNTFGGIILIAILVALLAREQPLPLLDAARKATSAMTERRLATAEADLAAARQLQAEWQSKAPPSTALAVQERQSLEEKVLVLEAENLAMLEKTAEEAEKRAVDPGPEVRTLLDEQRKIAREMEALRNTIQAQNQNSTRLQIRAAELAASIKKEREDVKIVKLRFPKERTKTTGSNPVIFRYGKIYPLYDERSERNTASITWEPSGGGELTTPMRERGWTMNSNRSEIDRWLRESPRSEEYLAFYIYPDSIDQFRAFREAAIAQGWEFGIKLVKPGAKLYWGESGSNPPPL